MSVRVVESPLPNNALLQRFVDSGDYTDCFRARINGNVSFPVYVEAFYTTSVFKAERFILRWLVSRPSTDDAARALAHNEVKEFAAWNMLDRTDDQLLMMDFHGNTCSWFMRQPDSDGTYLYFGSAIVRNRKTSSGRRMGWPYQVLLGFHRLYSRILLSTASRAVLSKIRDKRS